MHGPTAVKIELDNAAPDAERILGSTFDVDVIAPNIIFGEGPIWDKREKRLSFVDIVGDSIWQWKPGGKPECIMKPSAKANGMVLDKDGRLVVAGWSGRTVGRSHSGFMPAALTTLPHFSNSALRCVSNS